MTEFKIAVMIPNPKEVLVMFTVYQQLALFSETLSSPIINTDEDHKVFLKQKKILFELGKLRSDTHLPQIFIF